MTPVRPSWRWSAGAAVPATLKAPPGLVRGWRIENANGGARLVLDLSQRAEIKRRFLLAPADGVANYRYVIDIAADGPAVARSAPAARATASAEPLARRSRSRR